MFNCSTHVSTRSRFSWVAVTGKEQAGWTFGRGETGGSSVGGNLWPGSTIALLALKTHLCKDASTFLEKDRWIGKIAKWKIFHNCEKNNWITFDIKTTQLGGGVLIEEQPIFFLALEKDPYNDCIGWIFNCSFLNLCGFTLWIRVRRMGESN